MLILNVLKAAFFLHLSNYSYSCWTFQCMIIRFKIQSQVQKVLKYLLFCKWPETKRWTFTHSSLWPNMGRENLFE